MKRASWINVVALGVLMAAGCSRFAAQPEPSLYDRLGGTPAITAVVGDFLEAVGNDGRVKNQPPPARVPALKQSLVDLVCQATGGPCVYKGRDMKAAHAGMGITQAEFDAVVDDLVKTLDKYEVPAREKNELLAMLAPMRDDIVETN
ncbi:MAG: group I truncated hemoglobin [Nitrospirota bacterium]